MSDESLNNAEKALADLLTSPMRRKFVIAYVENGGKITAAAELAGFAHPAQQGSRLLTDSKVQTAIERYAAICARVAGETKNTVLERIINRANADIGNYFHRVGEVNGVLKNLEDMTKAERMCIKKISWNQYGPVLELHDAAAADRDLARLTGMEPKENQALTPDEAASLLAAAFDRMDASEERAEPS